MKDKDVLSIPLHFGGDDSSDYDNSDSNSNDNSAYNTDWDNTPSQEQGNDGEDSADSSGASTGQDR